MNRTPSVLVLHTISSTNETPKLLAPLQSFGFATTELEVEEGSCVQGLAEQIESASFASVVIYKKFPKGIPWNYLNPSDETFGDDLRDELEKMAAIPESNVTQWRKWLPFSGQRMKKRA